MIKRTALVFLIAFTCLNASETDFREAAWGMTPAEVKEAERSVALPIENGLAFEVTVAGLRCYAMYVFTDGKLTEARYVFNEDHPDYDVYMDDYENVHRILTDKYGEPTANRAEWTNRFYRNDETKWGVGLAMGHWSAVSTWETDETRITMSLKGGKYQVVHTVRYESTTLQAMAEAEKKKTEADDF